MGDSGGKSGKTSSTLTLPVWYQDRLQNASSMAMNDYNRRMTSPLPSLYVPISGEREAGLSRAYGTALGGSAVPRYALDEYLKTVRGEYLDPATNPHLVKVADKAAGEARKAIEGRFAGAGRFGSGAYANALTEADTNARAAIYADNYGRERGIMAGYTGAAPTFDALQYSDADVMRAVGGEREADRLAKAEEAVRQYEAPTVATNNYLAALYGNPIQKSGTETGRESSKNKFDWAGFVGGLLAA